MHIISSRRIFWLKGLAQNFITHGQKTWPHDTNTPQLLYKDIVLFFKKVKGWGDAGIHFETLFKKLNPFNEFKNKNQLNSKINFSRVPLRPYTREIPLCIPSHQDEFLSKELSSKFHNPWSKNMTTRYKHTPITI